ncbi:MAG TPA: VOC family protein [Opitutaceae bacterium]|nr:VOC family protein [Opitutaceae bacterium]
MSIKIKEIAYSCYVVTDFERARAFYETALGLKNTMLYGKPGGPQWAEYDIGSGTLAIGAGAPGMKPSPDGCSVAFEVEDFDAAVAHLRTHAVPFRMGPFETPVCHMAMISDPDGNSLMIHRRKS